MLAADAKAPKGKPAKPTKRDLRVEAKNARERFAKAKNAEHQYGRQLRKIAMHVGDIVRGLVPPKGFVFERLAELTAALGQYSNLLHPWARAVAGRMIADVGRRDQRAWKEHAQRLGRGIAREIREEPSGTVLRSLLDAQVDLITSLPREASERVQKLATAALSSGRRSEDLAADIRKTGKTTAARATLISRTETSRVATAFTASRAMSLGSTHFIWRSTGDADVRELHRELDGKVFSWTDPPIAGENGERALPGAIYNCRCFPEPLIPNDI